MALPDNLADLFGPKNNPVSPPVRTGLQHLGYKITWDALDDGTAPPDLQPQLAGLYDASRHRPERALAERLRQLVQTYPDVPVLKNFLMTTYALTGQKSRADAVLDQTVAQHPRYLLGLVNKAHQLLVNDNTAGVEALFGGPPTDLGAFYPDRSTFHASEVGHFTSVTFSYYIAKGDPDAAENRLRLLRDLGYHSKEQLRLMKDQLDAARMRFNLTRMQESREQAASVEGYFRAEDRQTTEPPVFEHPETKWLYESGFPLPADKLTALLSLPRASLTADLSAVLLDTIYRFNAFQEQDWDSDHNNFAGHALLLAAELRADECLAAVLETLRQDNDFQDYWWGDSLTDFYEPYFRRLLPQQADALKAFLLEPDVNAHAKSVVSTAYAQEAMADSTLKPAAQNWYGDVLTYFIDHADDEHLLDNDFLGFLISDITDLQLTGLLPLIRTAFARELVSAMIMGDLEEVERQMGKRNYSFDQRPLRSLTEQYDYLRDPAAWHKAHPNPEQEAFSADYMRELDEKESEWAFLYDDKGEDEPNGALFPAQQPQPTPRKVQPAPGRNDKVSVRYTDGTTVRDVKYKKVEADVQAGKCALL